MKIVLYSEDPKTLKTISEEVTKFDRKLANLVNTMFRTIEINNAVGLAAIQIGIPKRILVIHDPYKQYRVAMINPKIISKSEEEVSGQEGCLSFPGKYLTIKRPKSVIVQYKSVTGSTFLSELKDYTARIFFHEYDHLDGIVFINK
jgi:peptide deformylase